MEDLPDVLEDCSVTLYADDTVLLFASKSIAEIELKLNCDLDLVRIWMKTNQITFNINGQLFKRSLASVKQNHRVLSHFQ